MVQGPDTNGVPKPRDADPADGRSEAPEAAKNAPAEATKPKPRKTIGDRAKALWKKSKLDIPTLMLMAKGGLPPAIALSMYQSTSIAQLWPTLGYLLAVISALGLCIMPRAKFVQTMSLNVISICLCTAVNLLATWSAVRARQTSPSSPPREGSPGPGYNSSASVILAFWLFFQLYLVNTFRAKFPQFTFPAIMYCILTSIMCTYGPSFPNAEYMVIFAEHLLEVFLLAFAISTAVHFLIFPVSMRKVVFKEFAAWLGGVRQALKAELAYFHSLEDPENFNRAVGQSPDGHNDNRTPQAKAVKSAIFAIQSLHGKIHGDLAFAKREFDIGHLGPNQLKEMFELNRKVALPTVGLGAVVDIFEQLQQLHAIADFSTEIPFEKESTEEMRKRIVNDWTTYMVVLHDDLSAFIELTDEGIEHVLLTLKLKKADKKKKGGAQPSSTEKADVEERAGDTRPGSSGFAEYFEARANQLHDGKEHALRAWCQRKGIELPEHFFEDPSKASFDIFDEEGSEEYTYHQRKQRQLYMLLYVEYLLNGTARAVLEYVQFADNCKAQGMLSKLHFIHPNGKRIKKWFRSLFKVSDGSPEDGHAGTDIGGNTGNVELGSAYTTKKDPEHLPPTNWIERMGNRIRVIPNFLRSPQSVFGFRAACAGISIALIAFLRQTQHWYVEQRAVWSLIMVSFSMNPTAGYSVFGYVWRVVGTVIAMLLAWLAWYIPDKHTAGVIVFLWLFCSIGQYWILKQPQFIIVSLISTVTMVLIIGYQLDIRKVGRQEGTSNGQPYYNIVVYAPYRLATVLAGLGTAFIWTIFPYPISEHSEIRKGLGGALYLLANYYSVVHELIRARVRGDEGDSDDPQSPAKRLRRHQVKLFSKMIVSLTGLRTYSNFLKYEVPLGGKFPKKEYNDIINSVSSLLNFISLAGYASRSFSKSANEDHSIWSEDFRRVLSGAGLTSREISTLLCLLSASITNGQPLPPYLRPPPPYLLSQRMQEQDKDILSIQHINEPCYAAFAVMQISTRCIINDLQLLLNNTKKIVGELDFSYHIISTSDDSQTTLTSRTLETTKSRSKSEKSE